MANMLWEDTFYESGEDITKRILGLTTQVNPHTVADIAVEARELMKLRHVPLLLMASLGVNRTLEADMLAEVIQRPDELTEFVSIFWKLSGGRKPALTRQIKLGLSKAFNKFDEYQFGKYNRDADITFKDLLYLAHPKPSSMEYATLFRKIRDGKLATPDTWETNLSAGKDAKETFTRLIIERKLGALALLRNLRKMGEVGVDRQVIREALLTMNVERVLPFRFITAAKYAPEFESELEQAMFKACETQDKLQGVTVLAVDTSGSMTTGRLSGKSEVSFRDAAAALAMVLREVCDDCHVLAFGSGAGFVKPRRGFALNEEIGSGKFGHGTDTGLAVRHAQKFNPNRVIVITDEQSATNIDAPNGYRGYVINVSSNRNGIGYGPWVHLDGFSESLVNYIRAYENAGF